MGQVWLLRGTLSDEAAAQVILISLPQQAPGKFKLALSNVQKTTASVHLFSFTGKETKAMN